MVLVINALITCRLMEWLVLMVRWARSDGGGQRAGMVGVGFRRGDLRGGIPGSMGVLPFRGLFTRVVCSQITIVCHIVCGASFIRLRFIWMMFVYHPLFLLSKLCVVVVASCEVEEELFNTHPLLCSDVG